MASTTRRPSTAADRRAALEKRILSEIEELLRGGVTYTELSVEQIAHAAGISRSTFYLYFRDKVDVLLRLSGSLKTESFAIAEAWRPCDPDGGSTGWPEPTNASCGTTANTRRCCRRSTRWPRTTPWSARRGRPTRTGSSTTS